METGKLSGIVLSSSSYLAANLEKVWISILTLSPKPSRTMSYFIHASHSRPVHLRTSAISKLTPGLCHPRRQESADLSAASSVKELLPSLAGRQGAAGSKRVRQIYHRLDLVAPQITGVVRGVEATPDISWWIPAC